MSKKKYRIMYESKLYDASETMEILKKCPPDIFFKLYHKYRKELHPSMNDNHTTLSKRLDALAEEMRNGFKKLDTKMDAGFKRIDNRIDNLENDINTRLDNVEKRLDYNNLKKLPENSK